MVEPPGEVELAAALRQKSLFSAIGRYSGAIEFELAVDRETGLIDQGASNLAWSIISTLRILTLSEFLVPCVADNSWSTIAAITDGTCNVHLLEDVPQARVFGKPKNVTLENLKWIDDHLTNFMELTNYPNFYLAADSLCTHHQIGNERMVVAILWSGIEALFGINSELRFRVAAYVATILEPRGDTRLELYRRLKKLYDIRSKAVHGGKVSLKQLHEHIVEVRKLLSRLLCKFIEEKKIPTEEELDSLLFS